jgi:hypothetical protein
LKEKKNEPEDSKTEVEEQEKVTGSSPGTLKYKTKEKVINLSSTTKKP